MIVAARRGIANDRNTLICSLEREIGRIGKRLGNLIDARGEEHDPAARPPGGIESCLDGGGIVCYTIPLRAICCDNSDLPWGEACAIGCIGTQLPVPPVEIGAANIAILH